MPPMNTQRQKHSKQNLNRAAGFHTFSFSTATAVVNELVEAKHSNY
jgi:hypothetical protein